MFDAIAPRYDLLNRLISLGMDRKWRRQAVAAALAGRPAVIADVGAGTCDLGLEVLRQAERPATIIALDFAPCMLRIGAGRQRRAGAGGRLWPVVADALRPPLAESSVDAVVTAFVMRNLDSLSAAWAAFARMLRPGGRLVVLEMATTGTPWFRHLFRCYFHRWVPWLGRRVSGHSSAYGWLPSSVDGFPDPDVLADQISRAGFVNVRYRRLALGTVAIHQAQRPERHRG